MLGQVSSEEAGAAGDQNRHGELLLFLAPYHKSVLVDNGW